MGLAKPGRGTVSVQICLAAAFAAVGLDLLPESLAEARVWVLLRSKGEPGGGGLRLSMAVAAGLGAASWLSFLPWAPECESVGLYPGSLFLDGPQVPLMPSAKHELGTFLPRSDPHSTSLLRGGPSGHFMAHPCSWESS